MDLRESKEKYSTKDMDRFRNIMAANAAIALTKGKA